MASHGGLRAEIALIGIVWPLYPQMAKIGDIRWHNFLMGPSIKNPSQ